MEKSEQALQEVHRFWARFLETERVETPDEALNFMTNTWSKLSGHLPAEPGGKSGVLPGFGGLQRLP